MRGRMNLTKSGPFGQVSQEGTNWLWTPFPISSTLGLRHSRFARSPERSRHMGLNH